MMEGAWNEDAGVETVEERNKTGCIWMIGFNLR